MIEKERREKLVTESLEKLEKGKNYFNKLFQIHVLMRKN